LFELLSPLDDMYTLDHLEWMSESALIAFLNHNGKTQASDRIFDKTVKMLPLPVKTMVEQICTLYGDKAKKKDKDPNGLHEVIYSKLRISQDDLQEPLNAVINKQAEEAEKQRLERVERERVKEEKEKEEKEQERRNNMPLRKLKRVLERWFQ
jgi:hypothetical protein